MANENAPQASSDLVDRWPMVWVVETTRGDTRTAFFDKESAEHHVSERFAPERWIITQYVPESQISLECAVMAELAAHIADMGLKENPSSNAYCAVVSHDIRALVSASDRTALERHDAELRELKQAVLKLEAQREAYRAVAEDWHKVADARSLEINRLTAALASAKEDTEWPKLS